MNSSQSKIFAGKLSRGLLLAFVLFSVWPQPPGQAGTGILGRLTLADVLGGLGVGVSVASRGVPRLPRVAQVYLLLLLALSVGIPFSTNPKQTVIEVLIHLFLLVLFVELSAPTNFGNSKRFHHLLMAFASSVLVTGAFGIYNVFGRLSGLPRIPGMDWEGAVVAVGFFRNSGQLGAYLLIGLSILIPARMSWVAQGLTKTGRRIVEIAIILGLIGLVLSVKVAAILGFLVGLLIWVAGRIRTAKFGSVFFVAVACILVALAVVQLRGTEWTEWVEWKMQRSGVQFESEESFVKDNLEASMNAFKNEPITGTGLGGFAQAYGRDGTYEVHSTYFKMLGEGGFLGLAAYLCFAYSVISIYWKRSRGVSARSSFVRQVLCFWVGCLVSWGYTYHLRKREFWIALAIIEIASRLEMLRSSTGPRELLGSNGALSENSFQPTPTSSDRYLSRASTPPLRAD